VQKHENAPEQRRDMLIPTMPMHANSCRGAVVEYRQPALISVDLFPFQNPGVLWDGELNVVLTSTHLPNSLGVEVPTYCFTLIVDGESEPVGHVHLRVGRTENLEQYQGQIGYGVSPKWRGRHFAERATRLILPVAAAHGLNPVWITCDPDNWASRRTCERLGGTLAEIVYVPESAPAYRYGARVKCRYRLDLPDLQ
jgi:predicted acetyltransferase